MTFRPAVLAIAAVLATSAARADTSVLSAQGVAQQVVMREGRISFVLYETGERFVMDAKQVPSTDDMLNALDDSDKTRRGVVVHFYADNGRFEPGDPMPSFTARDIEYDGKVLKGQTQAPRPDAKSAAPARDKAVADLARGIALMGAFNFADARLALNRAATSGALEPRMQALALSRRGQMNGDDAFYNRPAGPERDALLRASLVDAMAWQRLMPESGDALAALADAKTSLGAYDEALAIYRGMLDKWPHAKYSTYMRIEGIYLTQGEYDKALGTLDDLVKSAGPQSGMAYHYHRGWVLSEMGRYDEAIAEFSAGLKSQPDYSWALVKRACAYGRTGKLAEAVADQDAAVKLFDRDLAEPLQEAKLNHAHAREILNGLRELQTKDAHARTDVACTGYLSAQATKRARSELLPPPQPAPAKP
jgi:tetratricopeptide (TPR) repeat protein